MQDEEYIQKIKKQLIKKYGECVDCEGIADEFVDEETQEPLCEACYTARAWEAHMTEQSDWNSYLHAING